MLLVGAYRDVTSDLRCRLLVAAAWPGPAGVVRGWPAWRRERIEELSRYCQTSRAAAIVNEIIEAAKQGKVEGLVQAVGHYERAIAEANADREVFSTLCSIWEAESEHDDAPR
jgi:hypothetical protein